MNTWQRERLLQPGDLAAARRRQAADFRPMKAGTAAVQTDELNAMYRADLTLKGGHHLAMQSLDQMATQQAHVDSLATDPVLETRLRRVLETFDDEATGLIRRYMRHGCETEETSWKIQGYQRRSVR